MDGKIVRHDQAVLHISTPAVRYGATAFEGVRAYWNDEDDELYVFRAREHISRLLQSARLMGMDPIEHGVDDVIGLIIDLLQANDVRQGVHLRPSMFVAGDGSIQARGPVSLGIIAVPSGAVVDTGGWDTPAVPPRGVVVAKDRGQHDTAPDKVRRQLPERAARPSAGGDRRLRRRVDARCQGTRD